MAGGWSGGGVQPGGPSLWANVAGNLQPSPVPASFSVNLATGENIVADGAGNVSVNTAAGTASVLSNSGNALVASTSGNADLLSNSGDATVGSTSGVATLRSTTGHVVISAAAGLERIELQGLLAPVVVAGAPVGAVNQKIEIVDFAGGHVGWLAVSPT